MTRGQPFGDVASGWAAARDGRPAPVRAIRKPAAAVFILDACAGAGIMARMLAKALPHAPTSAGQTAPTQALLPEMAKRRADLAWILRPGLTTHR
ncbi:hypothetical protein DTW92_17705 [Paracoccus pantotrophus]|nr:hypothetical protein DTW92_17705 [Paracoccus pantotrophus]